MGNNPNMNEVYNPENANNLGNLRSPKIGPDKHFEFGLELYKGSNYELAARCFEKAAEQGHATSQYYLGFMHKNGIGVEQNTLMADNLLKQAYDKGFKN